METKQAYQEGIEAEIEKLTARIDHLRAEAEGGRTEIIEKLEEKSAEAKHRLKELKAAKETAWRELKPSVDSALYELENAVERAASKEN